MATQQELEQLRADMNQAAGGDDDGFGWLVDRAMDLLCLLDEDVSRQLGVSRTTVSRWRSRVVVPHPLMRPAVFRVLSAMCDDFHQVSKER